MRIISCDRIESMVTGSGALFGLILAQPRTSQGPCPSPKPAVIGGRLVGVGGGWRFGGRAGLCSLERFLL